MYSVYFKHDVRFKTFGYSVIVCREFSLQANRQADQRFHIEASLPIKNAILATKKPREQSANVTAFTGTALADFAKSGMNPSSHTLSNTQRDVIEQTGNREAGRTEGKRLLRQRERDNI